jgi:hypothetical protein
LAVATTQSARFYTDGTVLAVTASPGRVYVGGNFSLIGVPTGSWVGIDPGGDPLAGRPRLEGTVTAVVADGHGGWFVAGNITAIGPVERSARIVHLRANGDLDRNWRVSVGGGRVAALALRGGTLFLAGDFKTIAGKRRYALAAVSASRGRVAAWTLRGRPRFVVDGKPKGTGSISTIALAPKSAALYTGGSFQQIGGRLRSGLAAVSIATGRATRWDPAPNGIVSEIRPRGRVVYVGGYFSRIGGRARNAVAAVDATTGRSRSFNAHAPKFASVSDLVVASQAIYVAGDFSELGGRSRHLLAALDPRSGAVTPWEPNISGDELDALAVDVSRHTLYVAGNLEEVGGQRRDVLAAVDTRSGGVTGWDPRALGRVKLLSIRGSNVFAGGDIAFVGGARRPGLASFTPDGALTSWNPGLTGIVRSLALAPDNSRLYVGGAFAPGDAPTQRNLAVVDTTTGTLRAFGGGTSSGVWAIAPTADGSRLYIGGAFVTVAGKRRTRLAALDPVSGALLPWNSGANDLVRTLLPTDDALYVGGNFISAGGSPHRKVVKLDPETGLALGWDPDADDNVWTLALRDEALYVGGEFGQIGGKARNQLAAVDVESGEATSWDPNAGATVRALQTSPDRTRLLAAGEFVKVGSARRGYAEFTLPQGTLTSWNPVSAFDGYGMAFTPDGTLLVIGGDGGVDVFR